MTLPCFLIFTWPQFGWRSCAPQSHHTLTTHFPRLLNDPVGWKPSIYISISKLSLLQLALYTQEGHQGRLPQKTPQPSGIQLCLANWEPCRGGRAGKPLTQLPPLEWMPSPYTNSHCLVRQPSSHSSLQVPHPHPLLALFLQGVVIALSYHSWALYATPVIALHPAHPSKIMSLLNSPWFTQ